MTRTTRYKLRYAATFAALTASVLLALWIVGLSTPAVIIATLLLLIPGRIQGHYYRDLFAGRRAMEAGDVEGSMVYTERFLTTIRKKPGLKSLIWLGGVIYTADPEAMALNNLGAAHLESARLGAAESAFRAALDADPLYPIPLTNLAVIREAGGDRAGAEDCLRQAAAYGYTKTALDRIVHRAGALLSRVEGRRSDAA